MLTRLIIRNYAIIPELDVSLQPGLTIITGETGAGKSILLGALGLALGKRAELNVVASSKAKCTVEAHFQLNKDQLKSFFEREGLDYEPVMICRREIGTDGRSRSFINDTPVSLKILQEATESLIELHHQNDNLALQSNEYQIRMLDIISGAPTDAIEYTKLYSSLQASKNELIRLKELEASSARKKDFISFQLAELEEAKLKPGEMLALEGDQSMLEHAEAIDQVLALLSQVLTDHSQSISAQLTNLVKQVESIRRFFPQIEDIAKRLESLKIEVQDLALESSRVSGPGDTDPGKLIRIQSRLNQLYSLIKKYNCADENHLMELQTSLTRELASLSSVHDQIEAQEKKIAEMYLQLRTAGEKLGRVRRTGAKNLVPRVKGLLQELGMPNASFTIEMNDLPEPGPRGMEEIRFMFSANKGMSMQPLQSVASGGELSRLSLALKSIYASQADLPTVIFDEIDTGISGEVAWKMGQLIRSLSKGHQVLMITHSPQIAAHAQIQYHVYKMTAGEKDISMIEMLTPANRLKEIAKMLSGDPPSKAALSNAESLIGSVQN